MTILQEQGNTEDEIIIKCQKMNEPIRNLLAYLKHSDEKVLGTIEDETFLLEADRIYYIEAVENKVFIYGEKEVYATTKKLYELEVSLEGHDFFRAGKSLILNMGKIRSVKALLDGRLEARLKNGEKAYISRKYVKVLREKLNL